MRDELEATLGKQVREVRLARELSQDEVARSANVSVGALRHLESGSGATVRTLVRVLRALGEEGWLATLQPPPPSFSPLEVLKAQQRQPARRVRRTRA